MLDLSKVELLLPMTGANNGTVFTDHSLRKHVVTRISAVTSTAQSKFVEYGSSGRFNGGQYLTVPSDEGFHFGSAPFTVEGYFYPTAFPPANNHWGLVGHGSDASTSSSFLLYYNQGDAILARISRGSTFSWLGMGSIILNEWNHVMISVIPSEGKMYVGVNGASLLTTATPFSVPSVTTSALHIGRYPGTNLDFRGHIQDLCITKGVAKYTASYTPPDRLVRKISGTIYDRNGDPCKRKVYAVSRATDTSAPGILAHGHSDATTGEYELTVPYAEVTRVVVSEDDESPLLNDLVDRIIPE